MQSTRSRVSFIPAQRKIITRGAYGFVRHPGEIAAGSVQDDRLQGLSAAIGLNTKLKKSNYGGVCDLAAISTGTEIMPTE
jgi:hypothetical protein